MSCTYKTCSPAATLRTSRRVGMRRPTLLRAIVTVIDAFQEALEMRRVANKSYFLGDE